MIRLRILSTNKPCRACPIHAEGCQTNCIKGRGEAGGIMLIGEAPGAQEDSEGKPFVGKSGKLLDSFIRDSRLNEYPVRITNVVRCRPRENRTPKIPSEARICVEKHLVPEIVKYRPRVIMTLGSIPMQTLTGRTAIWRQLGQTLDSQYAPGVPIVPCLHPANLMYHKWSKKVSQQIVHDAMDRAFRQAYSLLADDGQHYDEITWEEVQHTPSGCQVGFDIESNMLDTYHPDFRLTCASVAHQIYQTHYGVQFFDLRKRSGRLKLVSTLQQASEITGHNLRFDLQAMERCET